MGAVAKEEKKSFIVTPPCRMSYLSVFEPVNKNRGKKDKPVVMVYKATLLIPKTEDIKALKTFWQAAVIKAFGVEEAKAMLAAGTLKFPIKDADARPKVLAKNPEYKGHWFLEVATKNKPAVVALDGRTPITDPSKFYSGCWGKVALNTYPYDTDGNKGVNFGLLNLKFWKDDARFGGYVPPEETFEDESGGAGGDFGDVDDALFGDSKPKPGAADDIAF
jgi:hypothetical protein